MPQQVRILREFLVANLAVQTRFVLLMVMNAELSFVEERSLANLTGKSDIFSHRLHSSTPLPHDALHATSA